MGVGLVRLVRGSHDVAALARLDEAVVELSLLAVENGQWGEAAKHAQAAFDAIDELLDLLPIFRQAAAPEGTVVDAGTVNEVPLTAAELRLLPFLRTHLTYQEIADRLFLSRNTVSSQVQAIYRKLGATSRADAIAKAAWTHPQNKPRYGISA